MFSLLRANAKTAKPPYLKYWHKAVNWQIWEQIFKRIHDWVSRRFPEQKYGKRSIQYSQGKVILAKRMVNHEFSGPSWLKKMDRVLERSILKQDIWSHKPQLGRTRYVVTRTPSLRNSWKQTTVIITKRACYLCSHNAIFNRILGNTQSQPKFHLSSLTELAWTLQIKHHRTPFEHAPWWMSLL